MLFYVSKMALAIAFLRCGSNLIFLVLRPSPTALMFLRILTEFKPFRNRQNEDFFCDCQGLYISLVLSQMSKVMEIEPSLTSQSICETRPNPLKRFFSFWTAMAIIQYCCHKKYQGPQFFLRTEIFWRTIWEQATICTIHILS